MERWKGLDVEKGLRRLRMGWFLKSRDGRKPLQTKIANKTYIYIYMYMYPLVALSFSGCWAFDVLTRYFAPKEGDMNHYFKYMYNVYNACMPIHTLGGSPPGCNWKAWINDVYLRNHILSLPCSLCTCSP